MKLTKLTILGSTGSIGTQALEIVRANPGQFRVIALTGNSNWKLLAEQINEFRPEIAVLTDDANAAQFRAAIKVESTTLMFGQAELAAVAGSAGHDLVLNALVGFSGFIPTLRALEAGHKVALANKESLVVGGELLTRYVNSGHDRLIPVDSEHSAILQCLVGEPEKELEKLTITASGGPFRTWNLERMRKITVKDALNHPNWDMGAKITIDSATMMNKGLEIIEAHWFFDVAPEKIEAVVHPQSIIHSMVTFTDGSTKAQMGLPDMKLPIQYALTYPGRQYLDTPRLDWSKAQQLTFEPVDYERFPCLKLAVEALAEGGMAPAVLNASNEIAVARFLNEEISYIDIPRVVRHCLESRDSNLEVTLDNLIHSDKETRIKAKAFRA
ncbi:MAG: 1-deoxy-D-xylulose-5-phosphate reductoisomerase [Balneolaceae bacterium]|nr:MAG: 1-deoxy-D-xylulose-5-phosphate reductoisomerase [Balneolaceae bacterium]